MATKHHHRRFFIKDVWRKLFAIGLALIVWWLVNLQLRSVVPVQQVQVKVTYDTTKFFLNQDRFLVDLEASSPSKLSQLAPELFEIEVALPSTYNHSGTYYIKLRNRHMVKMPLRVYVKTFQPDTLAIPFDLIEQRQVIVRVNTQGQLKNGFELSASAKPDLVRIIGPSKTVRAINEISTEPLVLNPDITNSFSMPLSLVKPSQGLRVSPGSVTVNAVVENTLRSASQSFTGLVPGIMLPMNNTLQLATIPTQAITIRLRGLSRSLNEINSDRLRPFLDLSAAAQPGKYQAKVRLSGLPLGIETEEISPESIEVELVPITPPNTQPGTGANNQPPADNN